MDRERKKADRIEQELVYLEEAGMKNGSHFCFLNRFTEARFGVGV